MIPIKIDNKAINQANILGCNIIRIPIRIIMMPGINVRTKEGGFSAMPLHIDAIGHMDIGFSSPCPPAP
jgi:hypothetical protein